MKLTNSYTQLGDAFYQACLPATVSKPSLLFWNTNLASKLGFEDLATEDAALLFSGQALLEESEPVALAYAGHQFGHYNPSLGDGRAHLLGELHTAPNEIWDIQLKGSGRTRYSRRGDGLSALGPAIREYLMSEAMAGLGVPTTRSLAVVGTGDQVMRQGFEAGGIVTRIAASHLRVGTFQYFSANGSKQDLENLLDFAIKRHYPHISTKAEDKVSQFLQAVVYKQIHTVSEWMRVGFIHGVMNTDNTTISGETIDFGPCAMMGVYDPHTVYSSIDEQGRYSFGNQPWIMQWNMARLAEALLPLVDTDSDKAVAVLEPIIVGFSDKFKTAYYQMMASKFGLDTNEPPRDLIDTLLQAFLEKELDYTRTFVSLTQSVANGKLVSALNFAPFDTWWNAVQESSNALEQMTAANPLVIPRNHHVESIIDQCVSEYNDKAAQAFLTVVGSPYQQLQDTSRYQDTPEDGDRYYQTFCGT
ncbi:protein adenylyltransferase SelO family protein [Vibrio sp. SCSIO 43136]|uniref:protein adenylyltransferase SelO n=1 Tax=Vibrio sp. SCSIO 43136 TaxID=2819101 RepID=UPI002075A0FC|nr:YdiU family protein [Vibrio sp. SCSIO 43136]USD67971.1 YdiU family protein [Vibrio sp. SCSIO 43136]